MARLANSEAVLVDLDGCLWNGGVLLPRAAELARRFAGRLAVASNNSTHAPAQLVSQLRGLGFILSEAHVCLAGALAVEHAARRWPGARALFPGTQALAEVGQTYGAVVEAMCNGLIDVAFYGPVSCVQANQRGCARLLAVAVEKGESVYYAGFFARADSPIESVADLKGKRVAFGDVNSVSSFTFQMAMLLEAGIDPVKDLAEIRMTGSHANSIAALSQGLVDVTCASFDSYEKAVRQGAIDPKQVKVVAKSIPIPYPPLAVNTKLPEPLKAKLKAAFNEVHKAPGVTPEMIRGYGGKKVDAYNANYPESEFNVAAQKPAMVTDDIKGEILKKSAQR